jgi:uncharacterized protein (TIGR00369 family)
MSTATPPFDPKMVKFLLKSGHGGWLGLEYRDHGEDWFELALPWREELVGDTESQVLASGPILSLMDTATSLSVWGRLGLFVPIATLDLRIDYMRPARSGETVVGRGKCYHTTNSVAFVRGIAHDGDASDPVAHVAGCFMRTGTVTP